MENLGNIATIFAKYNDEETLTIESGEQFDAMLGDRDIVEVVCNESDEGAALATFESAIAMMGEVGKSYGVISNIEDAVATAVAAGEETTHETAVALTKVITDELGTIGLTPAKLGFEDEVFTSESAISFPVATVAAIAALVNAEDLTVEAGEEDKAKEASLWQKFKAMLAKLWQGAVAAWKKVKQFVLALFGNNEATAAKLLSVIGNYDDTVKEGVKLSAEEFTGKFLFLDKFDKAALLDVIENLRTPALDLSYTYDDFKKGVEAGNLNDFLKLSKATKVPGNLGKLVPREFSNGGAIPIKITGKNLVFMGTVTQSDGAKVVLATVEAKMINLMTQPPVTPMKNADIKSVLEKALAIAKSQKLFIKTMDNTVNAIKDIKPKSVEFAKNAKVSKYVSVLTSANSQYVSNCGTATKFVIQICGKQLSVKNKAAK